MDNDALKLQPCLKIKLHITFIYLLQNIKLGKIPFDKLLNYLTVNKIWTLVCNFLKNLDLTIETF